MQCTLRSLNLTFNLQSSKRDKWEGEALAQRMHKSVRNIKRSPQGLANKYLQLHKQIDPLETSLGVFRERQTRLSLRRQMRPASVAPVPPAVDRCHVSHFKYESLISNGQ
jgi:hypothetical protein